VDKRSREKIRAKEGIRLGLTVSRERDTLSRIIKHRRTAS
jgi:hypothetical protein